MSPSLVAQFVLQRELARVNHDRGALQPWCSDSVINSYRFCNVQREDDKVTRWLKKHWRDEYWQHPNFIPAMILARMVNWPPTLENIGFPDRWDNEEIVEAIHKCAARGKAWTGAYVITTCGQAMDKAAYVVGTAAHALAMPAYQHSPRNTLDGLWTSLRSIPGLGAGFLAAQVVADVKYTPLLDKAIDWWTFAVPGPGSRRGINRYFELPLSTKLSDKEWIRHLRLMINDVQPLLTLKLHAQDWQNVMCEFDKWMRVKTGQGRPRSKYKPDESYDV